MMDLNANDASIGTTRWRMARSQYGYRLDGLLASAF